MSGFDTGNSQGVRSVAQSAGPILRGFGPPVPEVGVTGAIYIDVNTFQLFERRGDGLDPWGHYLFVVPVQYQQTLKYYGSTPPTDDLGVVGDTFMQWGGWPSYGMNPVIYGPKQWTGWPELGDGPGTVIAAGTGSSVVQSGLLGDGGTLLDKAPSTLLAAGLASEYVIPIPVTAADGETVGQVGLQGTGVQITVSINPRYTAEDNYAVP